MVSWSIWKKRNTKLWDNQYENVDQVVCRAYNMLHAWQSARPRGHAQPAMNPQQQEHQSRWKP
ncbi:hypothetical protein A2U01_0110364, partial [Trifolium medium]|nr:hypothetical protein [Trifolium medium]